MSQQQFPIVQPGTPLSEQVLQGDSYLPGQTSVNASSLSKGAAQPVDALCKSKDEGAQGDKDPFANILEGLSGAVATAPSAAVEAALAKLPTEHVKNPDGSQKDLTAIASSLLNAAGAHAQAGASQAVSNLGAYLPNSDSGLPLELNDGTSKGVVEAVVDKVGPIVSSAQQTLAGTAASAQQTLSGLAASTQQTISSSAASANQYLPEAVGGGGRSAADIKADASTGDAERVPGSNQSAKEAVKQAQATALGQSLDTRGAGTGQNELNKA